MNFRSFLTPAALLATLALQAETPRITVDAARITAPVNPLIFGANIEAADDRGIFSRPLTAQINPHSVAQGEGTWNPAANAPHPGILKKLKEMRIGAMRYPGGCLVHNYNWKQAVGPLSERPDWKFGIDEYITLCRRLGAEPVFTLTDYALPAAELPQHMAELVEYLNAPSRPEYPWAMKRAAWGNPEPYRVKYFELGNESSHGNHNALPRRQFTPEEYTQYFRSCAEAMRKIDPSIQLGLVMEPGTGEQHDIPWNRGVLSGAGKDADFLVLHFYGPRIGPQTPEEALGAVLAYGDQVEYRLENYRKLVRELTGKELPIAMTEFNIGSTGNKPHPWRFTFLAGLMNADLLRIWLEQDLLCANYWQHINGYWGSFASNPEGEITLRRATMAFFEAWGRYTGSDLLSCSVDGAPRRNAAAVPGLTAARGDAVRHPEKTGSIRPGGFSFQSFPETITGSATPDGVKIKLDGFDGKSAYPVFGFLPRPKEIPLGEGFSYLISFEAKFTSAATGITGALGLGLVDQRGWDQTLSAVAIPGLQAATEFQKFSGKYQVLPDSPGSNILLRVEGVSAPFSGMVEIRNLVCDIETELVLPASRTLSALASRSADGNTLYLIVFNKDPLNAMEADIELRSFSAASGTGVVLSAEHPEAVTDTIPKPVTLTSSGRGFTHKFPAASMTALEFHRQ